MLGMARRPDISRAGTGEELDGVDWGFTENTDVEDLLGPAMPPLGRMLDSAAATEVDVDAPAFAGVAGVAQ